MCHSAETWSHSGTTHWGHWTSGQESAVVFRTYNYVSYNHRDHVLMKNWCFVAYWALLLLCILHSLGKHKGVRQSVLWYTSRYKLTVTGHYFYCSFSFLTHVICLTRQEVEVTNHLVFGNHVLAASNDEFSIKEHFSWWFTLYLNSFFCLESFANYFKPIRWKEESSKNTQPVCPDS